MIPERLMRWGQENPGKLFLIDGAGAIVSAFLLGVVLVRFEDFLGIPLTALYALALFPCLFGINDLYSYLNAGKNPAHLLKGIAILNTFYCFLSLGLALYHYEKLTFWGWAYILIEIMIVASLARFEYTVAQRLRFNSGTK